MMTSASFSSACRNPRSETCSRSLRARAGPLDPFPRPPWTRTHGEPPLRSSHRSRRPLPRKKLPGCVPRTAEACLSLFFFFARARILCDRPAFPEARPRSQRLIPYLLSPVCSLLGFLARMRWVWNSGSSLTCRMHAFFSRVFACIQTCSLSGWGNV